MGKFKASRIIVSESWNVLKQDKEMIFFPILSMVFSLVPFILLLTYYFFVVLKGSFANAENIDATTDHYRYLVLLVYYMFAFFIVNFSQAGVFVIANARFNGQNLGFSEAFGVAMKNIGKIFAWSLISATVGVILNAISEKSNIVGKIVAGLLGAAWNIMTYFSLISLVIGQKSIKDSFKDSADVIRKNWGETIIVNFGAGLFFMAIIFISFIVAIGIIVLVPQLMLLVLFLFFVIVVAVGIISSTLNSIFKLALYEYAKTGVLPQGFSGEVIQGAIKGSGAVVPPVQGQTV